MLKLPNQKTPILYQGITTELGAIHTERALAYGTHIVAGTSKDGHIKEYQGIPVFRTVKEALKKTKPQISVVFSTPTHAIEDVAEAIKAKIPMVICTTEHIPLQDSLKLFELAQKNEVMLIGPSSPGIVRVGECLIGSIPAHLFPAGHIAIMGRSSSLMYEAVQQLSEEALGISTCISLGAASLIGTGFSKLLPSVMADKNTDAVLIIGGITGDFEVEVLDLYKKMRHKKPILVYIPGQTLNGAIHTPLLGLAQQTPKEIILRKKEILEKAGIKWISNPTELGRSVKKALTN